MKDILAKVGVEVSEKVGRRIGYAVSGLVGTGVGFVGKSLFDKYDVRSKIEKVFKKDGQLTDQQQALNDLDERIKESKKETK